MKLRSHLIALVVASLLPVLLFAGAMIYISYRQQRADVERGVIDTARALSLAVDRELEASIRTLGAIATSEYLTSGDFQKFYAFAQDALKSIPGWESMALMDPAGRQLLNLRSPFGPKLPPAAVPNVIRQVLETKAPGVSNLFLGTIVRTPLVLIAVPVIRDEEVRYVLVSSTSPGFLATLLSQQKIPPDWIGDIADKNNLVIARTRELEKHIGKPATQQFVAESAGAQEGWIYNVNREGIPIYTAFSRSQLSGWTVALAIPAAYVEAPLRRTLLLMGAGGLFLLAAGVLLAGLAGYRMARAAGQLSAGARALGRGETPNVQPSPITELDQVRRELEIATAQRKRGENELRSSHKELRALAAYLQSAREEERRRIARELHDEIGQNLTGIKLSLERAAREPPNRADTSRAQALALTNDLIGRVRDLSLDLRPAMLDDLGLLSALTWHFARYNDQFKIKVEFKHAGLDQRRFEAEVETAAYRIVQEALTNVARHAGVDEVEVEILADESMLAIRVQDLGVGFDAHSSPVISGGLSGMRERAVILGGRLTIDSAPGSGTLLTAEFPLGTSQSRSVAER
jgi:signal transduction histidine kinase